MSGSEDEDKQHEPTQKKLDDARKKGDIARSTDLTTASAYGGLLLVAISVGGTSLLAIGDVLATLIGQADEFGPLILSGSGRSIVGGLMVDTLIAVMPWFLVPGVAALLTIIAQRSLVFAPDKLVPKLSRISILTNVKNKFGRAGLFEFAKSFFKLLIYSIVLGVFLSRKMSEIIMSVHLGSFMATTLLVQLCVQFLFIILMISAAIGVIDFMFQKQEHIRKNRMSRKEVTDEAKQMDGDPYMKQKRRQKGYEIANNRMLADVPDADVVIVNPTHFAVALKWSRQTGAAPVCVAKGVEMVAARIREISAESGVPIHSDPPTARALYATVEIGQEIQPDQYQAVAAAIRFSEAMRYKAKGLKR